MYTHEMTRSGRYSNNVLIYCSNISHETTLELEYNVVIY